MMMHKISTQGACLLAAALFLIACAKTQGPEERGQEGSGQLIRFGAVTSPSPQTRTAYSGEESGGKERIDWRPGDYVRIYSDVAYCAMNNTQKWADYRIATPVVDPDNAAQSWGEIVPISIDGIAYHGGLQWAAGNTGIHKFYSIYPSPKSAGAGEFDISGPSLSGMEIASVQTVAPATVKDIDAPGTDITVYYPPMSSAYMLAYLEAARRMQ